MARRCLNGSVPPPPIHTVEPDPAAVPVPEWEGAVAPQGADDPVAAVLEARASGRLLALATSGTSGTGTRNIIRSTSSWWDSFEEYTNLCEVQRGARVWVPGPLSATMNLFAAVHTHWAGASLAVAPGEATHACLTPAQLHHHGGELPAGCVVVVAGAALPEPTARAALASGLVLRHYYGAAELSFVASGTPGEGLREFPGVEVQVRDGDSVVAEGAVGEIWARSPYLSEGYVGGVGPMRRDPQGFATVGDLGRRVGSSLVVVGRPDAVVTAGATVTLSEVEAALEPHAGSGVAAFGIPHPTLGAVIAVAVISPSDRVVLQRVSRESMTSSHRPRVWVEVEALPLTAAGKVDRVALTRRWGGSHDDQR